MEFLCKLAKNNGGDQSQMKKKPISLKRECFLIISERYSVVRIAHFRYVWARELGTWFGHESEAWWNKAGKSKLTAAAKQHVSIYRS